MPCNCDHLESSTRELALSRVACLLDELAGLPINPSHWRGYHPRVYSKAIDEDSLIAELCIKLQGADLKHHSLEMQLWWRDHQAEDKRKAQAILDREKTQNDKAIALKKLTPYERQLLRL